MYRLYWSRNTGAFAVEAALALAGAAYELVPVDTRAGAHRQDDYLKINPRMQVPTLRLPDDTVMTESAAILMHLSDLFPEAGLLPAVGTAERAQAYRWLVFMAANVYEADLRYFYAERYAGEGGNIRAVREAALGHLDHNLGILAAYMAGRDTVLASGWSLCDVYLTMLCQWHPDKQRLYGDHAALKACTVRTLAQPTIAQVAAQHPELAAQ